MVKRHRKRLLKNRIKQWFKEYKLLIIPVLILITIVLVGSAVLGIQHLMSNADKKTVINQDMQLFDEAEQKLRQMQLPAAEKTEYKRSCSFRSVKFEDPGPPNCTISRIDMYGIRQLSELKPMSASIYQSMRQYNIEDSAFLKNGYSEQDLEVFNPESDFSANINLQDGLQCYLYFSSQHTAQIVKAQRLTVATNCYKEVQFQLFPED